MAVPRTKSHTFRAPPPATVTHGRAQPVATFSGRVRLGKRTKHLVKRLGPAVHRHEPRARVADVGPEDSKVALVVHTPDDDHGRPVAEGRVEVGQVDLT